ncbi:MAG: sensor domain-containing diguanylate cyclase, partial [Alphaproteobacteria bacterium]|nr:sensor domain-containing diguanylate cyclase [Alphaproteobacteria bacterium]
TVLLLEASSNILLFRDLSVHILFFFISLGLLVSLYAVFIADSAVLEENVAFVVPIIGLIYLFLSFVSQPNLNKNQGALLAAFCVVGLIEQMALNLFLALNFSFVFTLVLVLMLAGSYFLMFAEYTEDRRMESVEGLKKMSDNVENIIKSSPFPILISKLKNDTLVFANQNALKLFGINVSELSRYHFKDFFVDADNRKLLLERLEHNRQVQDFEILVKTMFTSTPFWLMVSANVIEYKGDMVLYCAFQDITSRKEREKMLQNQASRDPLTSIYNRRYFESVVPEKIKQAHKQKQDFALLMIDADHFKNINDQYGHKIGDKVLMELAHVVERSVRPDDVVARYGGEEFVVFLANVDSKTAVLVAKRLKDAISNAVVYNESGAPVSWTVSIGVAPSGVSDEVGTMIKMADDAMYLAKNKGRNRVEEYDEKEVERLTNRLMPREEMHPVLALEDNEEISLLDDVDLGHLLKE